MQSVYGETVYAHWNANSYNIRFDGNKASSGSMDAEYILYDETKPLTANAYKKTGYTFAGWNTKADGSGKTYHDEDNVLNLVTNGVITLYAQWSANHYSVVFDGNHKTTGGVVGAVYRRMVLQEPVISLTDGTQKQTEAVNPIRIRLM